MVNITTVNYMFNLNSNNIRASWSTVKSLSLLNIHSLPDLGVFSGNLGTRLTIMVFAVKNIEKNEIGNWSLLLDHLWMINNVLST